MNCSHNNMTLLPSEILPRTEQIIMAGNKLGVLDTVNENLTNIKRFDLQNSGITDTSQSTFDIFEHHASSVNLFHNEMLNLPQTIKTQARKVKLWLSGNPYECNCGMMWMKDWLMNASNVVDRENITCGNGKWKGSSP